MQSIHDDKEQVSMTNGLTEAIPLVSWNSFPSRLILADHAHSASQMVELNGIEPMTS